MQTSNKRCDANTPNAPFNNDSDNIFNGMVRTESDSTNKHFKMYEKEDNIPPAEYPQAPAR